MPDLLKGAKAGERYVISTPQGVDVLAAILNLPGEAEPWVATDYFAHGPISEFPRPGTMFVGSTAKKVWPEDD